jgi:hypothetical protein
MVELVELPAQQVVIVNNPVVMESNTLVVLIYLRTIGLVINLSFIGLTLLSGLFR